MSYALLTYLYDQASASILLNSKSAFSMFILLKAGEDSFWSGLCKRLRRGIPARIVSCKTPRLNKGR